MRKVVIVVLVALLVLANIVTPFKIQSVHIQMRPEEILTVGTSA